VNDEPSTGTEGERAHLDGDVVVAGVLSPTGASRQLLIAAADRRFELLVSVPLMLEWEAVLKRPDILRRAKGTPDDMDVVLDQLAAVSVPVDLHFLWRPRSRDPDDDMVLEAAINGWADVIATFNVRHLAAAALWFGVAVELPTAVLRRL
jgi:putative PIN family toxin of toxin-antitoxin system